MKSFLSAIKDNGAILKWWVIMCSTMFITSLLMFKGFGVYLWENDATKLSFITFGLFVIVSGYVGLLTYRACVNPSHPGNLKNLEPCWFATEAFMGLGMLGTLIGFLMLLAGASLDVSDLQQTQKMIFSMAYGMSTAVLTTLVGLSCSLLLKLQLINLEAFVDAKRT